MSTEPRTLPDELNSVLLAHSLTAPEPARTIDEVLARVAAEPHRSARFNWPRFNWPRLGWPRLGWMWRSQLTVWVAAVVVVGLLFVGARSLGAGDQSSKTSVPSAKAAAGSAATGQPASVGGTAFSGGTVNGAAVLNACQAVAPAATGLRFGTRSFDVSQQFCPDSASTYGLDQSTAAGSTSVPPAAAAPAPGQTSAAGQSAAGQGTFGRGAVASQSAAGTGAAAGQATPVATGAAPYDSNLTIAPDQSGSSLVYVTQHGGEQTPSYLIYPAQEVQVAALTVAAHQVLIEAIDANGDVRNFTFTSKDGRIFTLTSNTLLVGACTLSELRVTLTKPARTPSTTLSGSAVGAIMVANQGKTACALSGYPDVQAAEAEVPTAPVIIAAHSLAGPFGGVTRSKLAPVIVLAPGMQATSILESGVPASTHNQPCGATGIMTISLPHIGVVRDYSGFPLGLCGLQVHPMVAGLTGSD